MNRFGDRMHGSDYTITIMAKPLPILGLAAFLRGSDLPVHRRPGLQSAPVDSADQPAPFFRAQGAGGRVALRPREAPLVQTPDTQPDAGAVPNQQFDPVAAAIPKGVSRAIARRPPQRLLNLERQAIDPHSHIHRFHGQPDLLGPNHRRISRSHCAQIAACDTGQVTSTSA